LTTVYRDDEDARSSARKLMALPLIPLNQIERGFEEISNNAPHSIRPLVDYFNRFWMTKVKWVLWNVSDVDVRTNNIVEGEFLFFLFYALILLIRLESSVQSFGE